MAQDDHSDTPPASTRRTVLRGALLAGVATPLLAACGSSNDTSGDTGTTTSAASGGTATSDSGGTAPSSSGGGGTAAIAQTTDVPKGGGVILKADKVVVTQPSAGQFKGFSSTCTHMGCTLHDVTQTINCVCHGSQFSIEDGSVVTGPATKPLPEMPIVVSGKDIALA